ncbi:MAG: Rieske 2Fe-2S domain-containing protein [Actinobacteria bacterium]|nr:Rieske 2Fe-2S domain-containing protein [Actinomycetota bacterium]MBU1493093.1 Rieske 2Fe-2S domain-containing protein [Actinomycetota bacterium]
MTSVLVIVFISVAALLAAAVFAVAFRRGAPVATKTAARPQRPGIDRDVLEETPAAAAATGEEPVPVDPLQARAQVTKGEYDVTRRQFFNRGIYGIFGLFLAQFGIAGLAFMWPRLTAGGFGSKISAGPVADILAAVYTEDGRVKPFFVPAAQSYVLPFNGNQEESSFAGLPVVAEGLMAIWQRCVHLGCRVPECASSQGFECPCHGSKYNYHGEYEDGPAPRNLDRFVVAVNDAGELIIDTGQVIQTARSSVKTAEYPQGPSCR